MRIRVGLKLLVSPKTEVKKSTWILAHFFVTFVKERLFLNGL